MPLKINCFSVLEGLLNAVRIEVDRNREDMMDNWGLFIE